MQSNSTHQIDPLPTSPLLRGRSQGDPQHDALVSFGSHIKALEQRGDEVTVGGHGIVWGSPSQRDLVGDWFTPETYLGAQRGAGVDTMLHHGIPLKAELAAYADVLLPPVVKTATDEHGLLVATVLDLRNAYQRKIYEMVEADLLSWSSGAPPHGVRRKDNAKSGEITRWLIAEFSYTPTPCEPRLTEVLPLKALLNEAGISPHSNLAGETLAILKDGSRAGLTFRDHALAVRAAVEGFGERFFDWFDDRASSRKAGRVFSADNWQRLDELCTSLGSVQLAMRALLDEHQPTQNYTRSSQPPNEADALSHLQSSPSIEAEILQAQLRFAEFKLKVLSAEL
ncbi:MAG: hypothetical protein JO316_01305 [Abitibacteriaceae bacterium]|nr:hypothetical protein [Abditibacteriaceae bacterium]